MPTDFTLPELGENVTAGDVVRILVKPGDVVAKDQAVLELETDKATIEVPSSVAGTVIEVRITQGDRIKVGQVVLTVEDGAGAPAAVKATEPTSAPAPPDAGPGQTPASAAAKADGAAERDRSRAEPPEAQQAPDSGTKPRRGEVVDINRGGRPAAPVTGDGDAGPAAPAAPSVRRLARELGVEIRRVSGSGADGRISPEDVQAYVRAALAAGSAAAPTAALPDFTKWGEVERRPMSNIRRKTAEHLTHAWNAIPHVTQHDKADITAIDALRKQFGPQAEKAGGKLTMTAIALKIIAGALRQFPQFNASADIARKEIVYKQAIHIGVAADTDRGLLVPVIRDVDRKGIIELAVELAKVSEKARTGKLSLDDMQGGGFTITNLGGIGGTSFTPIVNWPEVAILGISRGAMEPVYTGHDFAPRLMLPLSLSYDHRVIDGADGARFLRWVAQAFEQPFVLAL